MWVCSIELLHTFAGSFHQTTVKMRFQHADNCLITVVQLLSSTFYQLNRSIYILSLLQSQLCLSQTQKSYLQRLSLYFLAVPIAPPDLLQLHEFFLATWSRKGRCAGRQGRSAPGVVLRCSGKWEEHGPRTYYWH